MISLLGLPSWSVPCGFTESSLSAGLQVTGRHHQDFAVLPLGHPFELAAGYLAPAPARGSLTQALSAWPPPLRTSA